MSKNPEIREQIVQVCQRLYQRNMLAAADGNVSFRRDDQNILFTPSGRQKGFIAPDDLAVVRLDGTVQAGQPSGERLMHLEIYRTCTQARAVVHAHPPHAVAWSLARPQMRELPNCILSEVILGCGQIPIVSYARPGSAEMGSVLREYLPHCRALILARHGAVCWGESLEEALNGMERLEHSAQILWLAESLGGATSLPDAEVASLKRLRAQTGDKLI